jgi:TonB family protein
MNNDHHTYGVYLRSGMLASLIITIVAFIFVPTAEVQPHMGLPDNDTLIIVDPFLPIDRPSTPTPPVRPPLPRVAVIGDGSSSNVLTIGQSVYNDTDRVVIDVPVQPYWKVQVPPKPVKTPAPPYPIIALQAGIEGTCVIKAVIDTLGTVVDVEVCISSGNTVLDEAALQAFRTYTFTPALQHDRPVSVWIRMPVTFKLQ